MEKQVGFTLIELMIALSLGLIIVAAAFLMLLSGQKNVALQKSSSSLQDDQNFGLSYIAKNIRQANLFNPMATMTATSSYGGIVFSSANLDDHLGLSSDFADKFATTSGSESNMRIKNGTSFTDATNDQLLIQYRPAEIGGYDCEGTKITSTDVYILERYFVRIDANGAGTNAERSALACAASRYSASLSSATDLAEANAGVYGSGQIIMKRVDLFNVRFLTQTSVGSRYMTVAQYKTAATAAAAAVPVSQPPRILAVQLGIIARAADLTTERAVSTTQEFSFFGQTLTQKSTFPNRYIRIPIVQTIALRNALGARS